MKERRARSFETNARRAAWPRMTNNLKGSTIAMFCQPNYKIFIRLPTSLLFYLTPNKKKNDAIG